MRHSLKTGAALIDTRMKGDGEEPVQLVRFQYADHLGSAGLELDEAGAVISFEEYYPFGSTSFQSGRSSAEVSLKRYRYTGKERDEESGFNYHGARYYAPWLLRWMAVDPLESKFSPLQSPYNYCFNNPVGLTDESGMGPGEWHTPLTQIPARPDYGFFIGPPTYETSQSNLQEVSKTEPWPNAQILVVGNPKTGEEPIGIDLKELMEYGGKAKEFISNTQELSDVMKNAIRNGGYKEVVDDGMRPLETVSMQEMSARPYIKSEGAILKEGVKEVFKEVAEHASIMTTVQDVGTKGPAYANPMTAVVFEDGYSRLMQKQPGGYGANVIEDAGFRDAASKGYAQLADYVNQTGNSSNVGFAYSTSGLIGRDGITFGSSDAPIHKLDARLATTSPLSLAELKHQEQGTGLEIKFAYWGKMIGESFQILGQYKIK